jgi:hypothetical protein
MGAFDSATEELWRRVKRPFDPIGAVQAFTGLAPAAARQLVAMRLAGSPEADLLLDHMHETVRSMAIATTSHPVRTTGEVRGPILWSETMSARTSSPGAGNVFICSSPVKAYDTPENRVLAHALTRIRDAAQSIERHPAEPTAGTLSRRARHNGTRAARALEHRTLGGLDRKKPHPRDIKAARSGSRKHRYRFAVAMLERAADPVPGAVIVAITPPRVARQHGLLLALLERLGAAAGTLQVADAGLLSGPVRYLHPDRTGTDALHGILLDGLLLDVPDRSTDPVEAERQLVARAHGHPALVVHGPDDLTRALRLTGFARA